VGRTRFELVTSSVSGKSRAVPGVCHRPTESNGEPLTWAKVLTTSRGVRRRPVALAPISGSQCPAGCGATAVGKPPRDADCIAPCSRERRAHARTERHGLPERNCRTRSLTTGTKLATLATWAYRSTRPDQHCLERRSSPERFRLTTVLVAEGIHALVGFRSDRGHYE
jgi:hypothetical protein